jgi:hypothetical protein
MKLTKLLLVMALAGSSLNQASAQTSYPTSAPVPAARHIGDGVKSVGDTNRYVEMPSDNRPAAFKPKATLVSESQMQDFTMIAPTVSNDYGGTSYYSSGAYPSSALAYGCGDSRSEWWINMDALVWFGQKRSTPPLITTASQGVLPVSGNPQVTNLFGGGDGLKSGVLPGFRLSGGKYIDSCQKIAIGGQVFGIFQSSQTKTAASDGSTSIGIPFYNDTLNVEDAYLVAFNDGNPQFEGSVTGRADLNMLGAEASGYFLLGRSGNHRIDLVSGYTYNNLRDSVSLVSTSVDRAVGNGIPDGTITSTNDLFANKNEFHGAHLGMLSSVVHQRITLSTLAKVSFGNMHQTASVRGSSEQSFNNVGNTYAGGILTQQSNITEFSRNAFAFIPQMNLKLGYALSECLQFNVGYSFMYWSNVGMAGNQIDHTVNITQALGGAVANRPAFNFQESGYWMQGVDIGLTMTY